MNSKILVILATAIAAILAELGVPVPASACDKSCDASPSKKKSKPAVTETPEKNDDDDDDDDDDDKVDVDALRSEALGIATKILEHDEDLKPKLKEICVKVGVPSINKSGADKLPALIKELTKLLKKVEAAL